MLLPMERELFGVRIDNLAVADLDMRLEAWLEVEGAHVVVTPNAEFLLQAMNEPAFAKLLNRSDVAIADSVSVQFAAAALWDERLTHRIPGVDLLERLCAISAQRGARVLLLGGAPGAAAAASRILAHRHASLDVVSIDPGHIDWQATSFANGVTGQRLAVDDDLVARINALAPRMVAVALGQHKQEQYIEQARAHCPSVRIWIGIGGALEMISGQRRRAPRTMRHLGLEWLWRLMIEPRRWRRIARASILFPFVVAREASRRGTLMRSTWRVFRELFTRR